MTAWASYKLTDGADHARAGPSAVAVVDRRRPTARRARRVVGHAETAQSPLVL